MAQKGKGPDKQSELVTVGFMRTEFKEMMDQMMGRFSQTLNEQLQAVKDQIGDLKKDTDEKFSEVYGDLDRVEKSQGAIKKSVLVVVESTEEEIAGLKNEMKVLVKRQENGDGRMKEAERDIMMNQYFQMEYAIRIRNWPENREEDLKEIFVKAMEDRLEEFGCLGPKIEKIYRVNSWFARNRNVPRDVVIYFNSKALRNEVVRKTYEEKLKLKGQEVMVLKELPRKMLAQRKEFKFMTDKLKELEVQFKWELPSGLSFNMSGTRRRFSTVQSARKYYDDVLAGSPMKEEGRIQEKERKEHPQTSTPAVLLEREEILDESQLEEVEYSLAPDKLTPDPEPKQKRVQTRQTTRIMREEQLSQQQEGQQKTYSEAVGGARPKSLIGEASGLVHKLLLRQDDN